MEYVRAVFLSHASKSGLAARPAGFVVCEPGPGDSLASAPIGRCAGVSHVFLVDAGSFATLDVGAYRALAESLRASGVVIRSEISFDSIPAYLDFCRATYMTYGLRSLSEMRSENVDMIWSHAVLEHVRAGEFDDFVKQLFRITKRGGVRSHPLDLQDHLSGALNNLRFSKRVWESRWFATSVFYTNRLQYSRINTSFRTVGFATETPQVDRWTSLPTPRHQLDEEFAGVSEDELLVRGFDLVTSAPSRH